MGEGQRSGLQELRTTEGESGEGEGSFFWATQEIPIRGLMANQINFVSRIHYINNE